MCVCALCLLSLAGCGREGEYERHLREKMKGLPDFVSAPMIEDALMTFRTLPAREQEEALARIKDELARRQNKAVVDALAQP